MKRQSHFCGTCWGVPLHSRHTLYTHAFGVCNGDNMFPLKVELNYCLWLWNLVLFLLTSPYALRWVHTCNVTAYSNAVTLQVTDTIRSYELNFLPLPHDVRVSCERYTFGLPVCYGSPSDVFVAISGFVHLYTLRFADGGDVSRCPSRPAQAVTISSVWCDGQIPTAHRTSPSYYRVTNFWYVTWSQVPSALSRYSVTLRGNVTSVYLPLGLWTRIMWLRLCTKCENSI